MIYWYCYIISHVPLLFLIITAISECNVHNYKETQYVYLFSCWSVQFSSVTQSCPTVCDSINRSKLGLPVRHQLPEFTQTHVHRVGDAIQPSHPLSSPSPPTFNLSQHQGFFKWVNSSIRRPKYWGFSFNVSPSSEYSGLIFFRMDWLDLFAVQGTLKSLLQHHSLKASILRRVSELTFCVFF